MNKKIANHELCYGCGTCISFCTIKAAKLINTDNDGIKVDISDICTGCTNCYEVCPAINLNFNQFQNLLFNEKTDSIIGNTKECYIGHSNDQNIRYNSSSGGVVTQLLIFALENKIIDGAIVTRMKNANEAEPFIARTKDDLIKASKSKYLPVPVNIIIKTIMETKNEKFAFVGLPCHINGIRKAEKFNEELKSKIILKLGIFCSHTNVLNATYYLFNKLSIKKDKTTGISYRGEGWPGKVKIFLSKKTPLTINNQDPLITTIFNDYFFAPQGCILCNDLTAELADISFGDPWIDDLMKKEQLGKSIIISRTNIGHKLINQAFDNNYIQLSKFNESDILKSQKTFLYIKKINIWARISLLNLFNYKTPEIITKRYKIKNLDYVLAIFPLFARYMGSKFYFLLKYVPYRLIRIYSTIYYYLCTKAIEKHRESYETK